MKKPSLNVTLHVATPSTVELGVAERVQLDRLVRSPDGELPRRHGNLLDPGVTRLSLDAGRYFFKTLAPASLRTVTGGVTAAVSQASEKDPVPVPPPPARGDEPAGEAPELTLL